MAIAPAFERDHSSAENERTRGDQTMCVVSDADAEHGCKSLDLRAYGLFVRVARSSKIQALITRRLQQSLNHHQIFFIRNLNISRAAGDGDNIHAEPLDQKAIISHFDSRSFNVCEVFVGPFKKIEAKTLRCKCPP